MRAVKNISFRRRLVILAAMALATVIVAISAAVWPSAGVMYAQSADPATASDMEILAATLWISRHSSELVAVSSEASNLGMTVESLRENAIAVKRQQAGLRLQLAALAGKGYDDRAGRIQALADRLRGNTDKIVQGRPNVLAALGRNARTIAQLRRDITPLISAAHRSTDAHFYDLTEDEIARTLQEDAFRYARISGLASDLGTGGSILVTALELEDPSYVGLTEEIYLSAASRIRHNLDYLTMNPGRELDPQIVAGANTLLAVGRDQFFEDLEQRFSLVAEERDLIEDNALTLRHLLYEVDGLGAEVLGTAAPTGTSAPEDLDGSPGVPGVSQTEIRFGQSADQSGSSRDLGLGMKLGITAAFEEANRAGGVQGRELTLDTLDDGYEPQRAFFNTQRLLESENVFGLVGSVGTPTSRATTPLARADGAPFVAPFTGAQLLREGPELDNVVNYRASYHQETERLVEGLTEDLDITRVAVLYQNDSYGVDGLTGVRRALARRGLEPVAAELYRRNTSAIKRASFQISEVQPEAVIIIGTHEPAAAAIKLLRDRMETAPIFMSVSFVGSKALADELRSLGDSGAGVYVTQVTPLYDDLTSPVVRNYQAALSAVDRSADTGFVSFEGYLAGRLAIEGLELCPTITRECFLEVFHEARTINIDDIALRYGPGDNQGSDTVFLTMLEGDGNYRQVDKLVGDSCSEVISEDGPVKGTWAAGCQSQVTDRGYARYYTFTLQQESDVTIDLMSSVDPVLFLREGEARSGTVRLVNDDVEQSVNLNSRINARLPAGTYTIEATTYVFGETGAFTLTVSGLSGMTTDPASDAEMDPCAFTAVTADGTTLGTWRDDCQSQVIDRGYARYYTFTLQQGSDVTIDLMSSVDPILFLREGEARSGTVRLLNDDVEPGVNLDSRISASLSAGTYTIEATAYNAGDTGTFALTVSGLGRR